MAAGPQGDRLGGRSAGAHIWRQGPSDPLPDEAGAWLPTCRPEGRPHGPASKGGSRLAGLGTEHLPGALCSGTGSPALGESVLCSKTLSDPRPRSLHVLVLFFGMRGLWCWRCWGMLERHLIPKSFFICHAIWFLCCPLVATVSWAFFLYSVAVTILLKTR